MISIEPHKPEVLKLKKKYQNRYDLYLWITKGAAEAGHLMEFYETPKR